MISAFRLPFSKEKNRRVVVIGGSNRNICRLASVVVESLEATSLLKWKQDQHGNSKVTPDGRCGYYNYECNLHRNFFIELTVLPVIVNSSTFCSSSTTSAKNGNFLVSVLHRISIRVNQRISRLFRVRYAIL
jgi:hypothetical protein